MRISKPIVLLVLFLSFFLLLPKTESAKKTPKLFGLTTLSLTDLTFYSVQIGMPADLVGIRPGDIVTSINEKKIATYEEYTSALATIPVSEPATFTILRNSQELTMTCTRDIINDVSSYYVLGKKADLWEDLLDILSDSGITSAFNIQTLDKENGFIKLSIQDNVDASILNEFAKVPKKGLHILAVWKQVNWSMVIRIKEVDTNYCILQVKPTIQAFNTVSGWQVLKSNGGFEDIVRRKLQDKFVYNNKNN